MSAATNLSPAPVLAETPPAASAAHSAAEFRSRMGKISWQSAVYFAGTILTTGAGYFFRIYLARTLGVEALIARSGANAEVSGRRAKREGGSLSCNCACVIYLTAAPNGEGLQVGSRPLFLFWVAGSLGRQVAG